MADEIAIELHNVSFGYGPVRVFDGLSIGVRRGECLAVLGPSGCGKTTLLHLMAGILRAEQGRICANANLNGIRPRIGLILQDHGLLPWATVWDNATLACRIQRLPRNLYELNVSTWLDRLNIAHLRGRYPAQLSTGQRQRVAIARTLSTNPDLVLLDEPLAAIDAMQRERLQDVIRTVVMDGMRTVVLVTHSIEEATYLGDRVAVLGSAPNRSATLIDNRRGAGPDYRSSSDYLLMTREVRIAAKACGEGDRDP